jgi:hypothetical protein
MAARGLPDPQGIVSSLGAVSRQMFRDMSGVAEAARVAQTSLQEAMSGATAAGEAASENLRAGMEQTRAVLEQVIDMNEKFATLLAEQGFGLMTDAANRALGSALGGEAGGLGSIGGAGTAGIGNVLAGSTGAGVGSGSARSGGSLAQRNASIAGAILNRAADRSAGNGTAPGGAVIPEAGAAPSGGPSAPSAGGGDGRRTPGSMNVPQSRDLEGRILGELGGVPQAGGAVSGPITSTTDGDAPTVSPAGTVDDMIRSRLLPKLAGVADSDDAFFDGVRTTLDLMAELQMRGDDDSALRSAALAKLVPGWNAAVDRAVADFNSGDSAAIHRLDRLLAVQGNWSEISGTTSSSDVIGRLQASVSIEDITAPNEVEGGEMVTIAARIMMRLPDGSTRPAAGAPVHLVAYPSIEEHLSGIADDDGRVTFSFRHGVPEPDFAGVHRFAGFLDLEVYLSASAPFSILISNSIKHVVTGAIAITLEEAVSDDDGSTALIGSIVHAKVGVPVLLNFRATKGGQPLQEHAVKEIRVNGAGTADTTNTDAEGSFTVTYLTTTGSGTIAYLSPVVETSQADSAAGLATIQIV